MLSQIETYLTESIIFFQSQERQNHLSNNKKNSAFYENYQKSINRVKEIISLTEKLYEQLGNQQCYLYTELYSYQLLYLVTFCLQLKNTLKQIKIKTFDLEGDLILEKIIFKSINLIRKITKNSIDLKNSLSNP